MRLGRVPAERPRMCKVWTASYGGSRNVLIQTIVGEFSDAFRRFSCGEATLGREWLQGLRRTLKQCFTYYCQTSTCR